MPGIERLHLEEAFEDSPQMRSLVGVFEKDCNMVRDYMLHMNKCCTRVLNAEREMTLASQELSRHLKTFEQVRFPLDGDNTIMVETLKQFTRFLDEISSLHQILATQFGEQMMYPLSKFMQADMDEVTTMSEMYRMSTTDLDESLSKYMRLSKKKDNEKVRQECVEDVYAMKKKFHQTAMHYYSALNSLQYKRKTVLLEPLVGMLQSTRSYVELAHESLCKDDLDQFLTNVTSSIQGVKTELNEETKKTVELVDAIEQNSEPLYSVMKSAEGPYLTHLENLTQKAGYLFMRSKQGILNTKWDRYYLFIQGGNLMCQRRDEFAGSLIMDLNESGVIAEGVDCDDRRHVFHVVCSSNKQNVTLQAENEQERDEWIATINNVAKEGGYVKGPKEQRSSSQPVVNAKTPQASNTKRSSAGMVKEPVATPPSPQDAGLLPDAPIQFDLPTPSEDDKHHHQVESAGRVNPFDKASGHLLSQNTSKDSFLQTFVVRFLGSIQTNTDRGELIIYETMRRIRAARAIHNLFKTTESHLVISSTSVRLLDPANSLIRAHFSMEDIAFWAPHKDDKRLLGFIVRHRGSGDSDSTTFTCNVFECDTSADEICHALGTAAKLAYEAFMARQGKNSQEAAGNSDQPADASKSSKESEKHEQGVDTEATSQNSADHTASETETKQETSANQHQQNSSLESFDDKLQQQHSDELSKNSDTKSDEKSPASQ